MTIDNGIAMGMGEEELLEKTREVIGCVQNAAKDDAMNLSAVA